jgi:putative MATE family efflux protein
MKRRIKKKKVHIMNQHDFTKGNIMKQIVVFSTPIMMTNMLQVSYQFIDSLWVGNLLGANALGAIAVSGTVIFTILSFIIGVNNAALTILSQQKGKNSDEGLKNYLNAFTVVLTVMSVALGAIGFFFSEKILILLQTPSEMIHDATSYLKINFIRILFLFGYNFISTVLRALGDSKTPLRFVSVAVILNTVLAPFLISTLNMGIEGAAYATIFSQGVAFLYGLYFILSRKLAPFAIPKIPRKEEVMFILKLGIPSGLQMTVISAGVMAIMSVVNSFGSDVVAGFGASQRIDSIIMLPAMALGTAVNSMAGQNIGANEWGRVHKISLYGVIYNFAIMTVIAILTVLFAEYAIRLFIQEKEAVAFGSQYLRTIAFFYPFLGINFILNGVVRGAGAMFQVLVLNIISFWVLRYPLTFLFSNMFGEQGISYGMGLSFMISSVFAFLYYRYGKWDKKAMMQSL